MARKNRNSRARKLRNQQKKEQALQTPSRERSSFHGKVRKGDAVELSFTFSGVPVPFDESPVDDLQGKTRLTEALWESLDDTKH